MHDTKHNRERTAALSLLTDVVWQQPQTGTKQELHRRVREVCQQIIEGFRLSRETREHIEQTPQSPRAMSRDVDESLRLQWSTAISVLGAAERYGDARIIEQVSTEAEQNLLRIYTEFGLTREAKAISDGFERTRQDLATAGSNR